MKKIAVVHPFLETKSGSGSIYKCLKIIEVLKDIYDLSLITGTPKVDFPALNKQWGTNIRREDIHILKVPLYFLRYVPLFMGLRHSLVGRYCRAHGREFDVMISAYSPYDFGVLGIQFIGDLIFSEKLRAIYHSMPDDREAAWFYKDSWWRMLYLKAGRLLYPATEEGLWRNLTVSNSRWTRDVLFKAYGVESLVIYPPVPDIDFQIPWNLKEEGFVTISNLVPFKQVERSIRIIQAVRSQGFDVHLHIVGDIVDRVYANKVLEICRQNADWCFYEGPRYGRDKVRLIDAHKYGIHGAETEAFGIAVAEMIKAGCVVWVAEGGGQSEIVEAEHLIFRSEEDAVRKILAFRRDRERQDDIRRHLNRRAQDFALENYSTCIRSVVADFIKREGRRAEG